MTYVASIELIDATGDAFVANFDVVHVAGEGPDAEPVIRAYGDWTYALTLSLLEDDTLEDGTPFDGGLVRLTVAGPHLGDVATANVRLIPDDGGSDLDDQGDDGDPESVQTPFVGAWHGWDQTGDAGTGSHGDGGRVSFGATVAAAGDFGAPRKQTDMTSGSSDSFGVVYRVAGFASGTKRSTSSSTQARPETAVRLRYGNKPRDRRPRVSTDAFVPEIPSSPLATRRPWGFVPGRRPSTTGTRTPAHGALMASVGHV